MCVLIRSLHIYTPKRGRIQPDQFLGTTPSVGAGLLDHQRKRSHQYDAVCRSRVAGEPDCVIGADVADPTRSPASRLLQELIRPGNVALQGGKHASKSPVSMVKPFTPVRRGRIGDSARQRRLHGGKHASITSVSGQAVHTSTTQSVGAGLLANRIVSLAQMSLPRRVRQQAGSKKN
jgi:hypothetical protein